MSNVTVISNVRQLSGLRSDEYENIVIRVTEYNSDTLKGTKVTVLNVENNDYYYSTFFGDIESTLIKTDYRVDMDTLISSLNALGFKVSFREKVVLPENVVTALRGLYQMGYRYITAEYVKNGKTQYAYDGRVNIKHIVVSDGLDKNAKYIDISESPDFALNDYDWVKPTVSYPIEDYI